MNWKKFFLYVGIPLLIFYIFLITIYFAFISGLLIIVLITGICCLRKKNFWRRAGKLPIALFICFFILVSNPFIWPEQFYRHVNVSTLITPNAPAVTALNSSEPNMLYDWLNSSKSINETEFAALDKPAKLELISDFCLFKIQYLNIHFQYFVILRVATPTEALISGHGDCQAQAVVTASFLQYLGYNAYAAETPLHWYTVVFLEDGTPIYLNRIINNGFVCSGPEILINQYGAFYTMNWLHLIVDVATAPHFNNTLNESFQDPMMWLLFPFILLAIAALFTFIIRFEDKPSKKEFLRNTLLSTLVLNVGFITLTILSYFFMITTIFIMLVTIIATVQLLSHNFFFKR
ncbi:MAG: hypothetical protein ACTSRW_12670 [Candidatus Helarchaeota archaeon]